MISVRRNPFFQEELARSLRKRHVILKRGMGHGQGRRAQTDFSDHARQKRDSVLHVSGNLADFVPGYANAQ